MININDIKTWMKLAKKHKLTAPKYLVEGGNTLAFGLVEIPDSFDEVTKDKVVVFTIAFVKADDPTRYTSQLCSKDNFRKFMTIVESQLIQPAQRDDIPDTYFEFFDHKSDIFLDGISFRDTMLYTFRCNKLCFIPKSAILGILMSITPQFVQAIKSITGVDRVTLEEITNECHSKIKFYN